MTPEDAIYRKIYAVCMGIADTYDYLPDGDEHYPFIFVGRTTNDDESNSDLMGSVNINIDVYGLRTDTNTLGDIKVQLHNQFIRLEQAFNYHIRMTSESYENIKDNTDRQPLARVLVSAVFQYTKKENK